MRNTRFAVHNDDLKLDQDPDNGNKQHNIEHLLAAIFTALRPYPEALAHVERSVAQLLGDSAESPGAGAADATEAIGKL